MGMPTSYYMRLFLLEIIRGLPADLAVQLREPILQRARENEFEPADIDALEKAFKSSGPSTTSLVIYHLHRLRSRIYLVHDLEEYLQYLNQAIRSLERLNALDQRTRQSISGWVAEETYNDEVRRLQGSNLEARLVGKRWAEGVLLVQYEVHRRLESLLP